ncbi:MAG TPA: alpha/beta hydrolase [Solirubrobacterales bacterium]|jgi:pimeloyl-ACP methyl ester carboxylesterase|nr:alpha/beta hydrolase [Solirubrobacterales bacterium]
MNATDQAQQRQPITEHREQIAGTETFWRAAKPTTSAPVLYVHGVPTNSHDWIPFLEKTGGVALDLPGFGASEKPHTFDYSIGGYNAFLQAFIGQLGWDRFSVVVHDWGGLALVTASELHDRVEKVIIINAAPLLPGYRWHRIARIWRTPLLGEVFMGLSTKSALRFFSKESRPSGEPWPDDMMDAIWNHFDHGTQRAILKLYRSAPPETLETAGSRLDQIDAPTLVLWGEQDVYIASKFAKAYAERMPNATLELLPDAGHWPWIDRADTVDKAADFLLSGNTSR